MSRSIDRLKLDKVFKKLRMNEDDFKNIKISGPYYKYNALLNNKARILLISEDDLEQKTCNHITKDFWDMDWDQIQMGEEGWDSFMNKHSSFDSRVWDDFLDGEADDITSDIQSDTDYGLAESYEGSKSDLTFTPDDYIKELLYYEDGASGVHWLTNRDDLLDDEYLHADMIISHIEENNLERGNHTRVDKELLEKVMMLLDHSDNQYKKQGLMLLKDFNDPDLTAALYEEWYPYWDITEKKLEWLDDLPDYYDLLEIIKDHVKAKLDEAIDWSKAYTTWRTLIGENITKYLVIHESEINYELCDDVDLSERLDLDFYDLDWEPKKLIKVGQVILIKG